MVQVVIDVDACTDLVARLREFHDTASHQRTRVQRIAHRARCSSVGVDNLETELDLIARSASDLDARVVLAVLVNTGDAHPTAGRAYVFSVEGADTPDAVRLALGKQLGVRLADVRAELQQFVDGVDHDDTLNDPVPPELMTRLAGYVFLLEKYEQDGPVATGLLMSLGADGFLALPGTIERALVDYPQAVTWPDGSTVPDGELLQRVLQASAQVLTTGVRWDKEHRVDVPYGTVVGLTTRYLPDDFGAQLAQSAYDHVDDGHGFALSNALRDGDYPTQFLLAVGDRLDALEQEWTAAHHGAGGPWYDTSSGMLGSETPGPGAYYDPFIGLFEAMGRTPIAAADFFNPDAGGPDALRRAEYYFHDRSWAHDGFNAVAMALDAAGSVHHVAYAGDLTDTRTHALWSQQAEQSAWITSAAVHYLGTRDQNRRIGDEGKRSLAHLLAGYIADVDVVAMGWDVPADPEDDKPGATGIETWERQEAWFDKPRCPSGSAFVHGDLNALLGEVLADEDSAAYFGGRTTEFNEARIRDTVGSVGTGSAAFQAAVSRSGSLRAYALATMGVDLATTAQNLDSAADAYMTAAGNAVGIVPVYGGALTFAVDAGLDAGRERSLRQRWTGNEEAQLNAASTLEWITRQELEIQVALALQDAGVIDTGITRAEIQRDSTKRVELVNGLKGGDGTKEVLDAFGALSDAFRDGAKAGGRG